MDRPPRSTAKPPRKKPTPTNSKKEHQKIQTVLDKATIRRSRARDAAKTPVPKDRLFAAAFVLVGSALRADRAEYRRFLRHAKCGLKELSSAVEAALNAAFATRIPPMEDSRAPAHLTPSGLGWPLELAEWLCAEYGWHFAEVMDLPLAAAFALQAAARLRHGGKHGGPDYVERTLDIVKNSTH